MCLRPIIDTIKTVDLKVQTWGNTPLGEKTVVANVDNIRTEVSVDITSANQPPGNIVASDYQVTVTMKSDQAEKEQDYRVRIKTESYIPYIGAAVLILVAAGLFVIYRKYGRL